MIISWAGKGSSGKTSIVMAGLRHIDRLDLPQPILVVDADPQQSLSHAAGWTDIPTVGDIRSRWERDMQAGTLLRPDEAIVEAAERLMTSMLIRTVVVKDRQIDVVRLGRWGLDGSQCTTNRALAGGLLAVLPTYRTVILDHEAGLEHLGRYAHLPAQTIAVVTTPRPFFRPVTMAILQHARTVTPTARRLLVGNMMMTEEQWMAERAAIQAEDPDVIPVMPAAPWVADGDALGDPRWNEAVATIWRTVIDNARHAPSPLTHTEPELRITLPEALRQRMLQWMQAESVDVSKPHGYNA